MSKPRYDDKYRASAVVMLQAAGWPDRLGALAEVAKHLGMTDGGRTLSRWAKGEQNPPPDQMVAEKTQELSGLFEGEMRAIFGELKVKREEATYRDLGVVLGIVADKWQLLNELPTEITRQEGQPIPTQRTSTGVSTLSERLASGPTPGARAVQAV